MPDGQRGRDDLPDQIEGSREETNQAVSQVSEIADILANEWAQGEAPSHAATVLARLLAITCRDLARLEGRVRILEHTVR